MHRKIAFIVISFTLCLSGLNAQEWSFGFRAGLNYNKLMGPSEVDAQGNNLESFEFTNGFHIGGSVQYAFTDLVGVRADLLFSQWGTEYKYNGDSYYFLARNTEEERLLVGQRTVDRNDSKASLEMPVFVYYKLGPLELSGGVVVGLIAASTGGGSLNFDGASVSGNTVDPVEVTLTYNYNKDAASGAGLRNIPIEVDGTTILYSSRTGAYYDYDEKDKSWYKTLQFGLTAGLAFYLNEGLYIGGRMIYGLSDADRNEYDISYHKLNPDGSYIQRADKNTTLAFQATLGFLF